MKVHIHAISHIKSGPEYELIKEYKKRLRWPLLIREFHSKKSGSITEIKSDEATLLLQNIPDQAKIVALDERGANLTSQKFASLFRNWQNQGLREVYIIIGGSDGLDQRILDRAQEKISFGSLTWPHKLVRVMLVEQIYRAQ